MTTVLTILAIAVAAWILLMLALKGMAALLRKSAVKAVEAALHGETILRLADNVSYLGADFPGPNLPPRTSGVLALTESKLLFLPWFPRRAITLPRGTISGVSLRGSFRDMAFSIPVLSVEVKGVGNPDGIMAWLAHEAGEWEGEIRKVMG